MHLLATARSSSLKALAAAILAVACFETPANTATEAERVVSQFVESSGTPGLAVSVGRCDRIVWSEGFGFADLEQAVRVEPSETKFRIGSVAKPMTALALATLVASGRINLDADVRSYVPAFPRKTHDFSVRQLAGHLAGIRHYVGEEAYSRTHYASVDEALAIFKDDPLVAAPGEEWRYSSYGYNLLAAVVERASNKTFLDYLAESVFTPLAMADTEADRIDRIVPHRGRYYLRRDGKFFNEAEVDNSNKWASGGILSTTDDLVRFGLAHFDDRLVSPDLRNILWTEQKTSSGTNTGYGLGWRIVLDAEGSKWIGHGGGSIGGTTQFWLFPDGQLVIAVASNLTELDYGDLLPKLRDLFSHGVANRTECSPSSKPQGAASR